MIRERILFRLFFSLLLLLSFSPFCTYEPTFRIHPSLQVHGLIDVVAQYMADGDLYVMIINVIQTLPWAKIVLVWVLVTMIMFYATSFDSIAYTASCYSYHKLEEDEHPPMSIQLLWCVLLILLPVALVFSDSSMSNIQTVSIIAAFPVGMIMIMIVWSFLKDAKKYMGEIEEKNSF